MAHNETKTLASGTFVEVDERGHATFLECPWLIQVANNNPEPDSISDCYDIVPCGGRMHFDAPDGMACQYGHEFGNLERRWAPFGPEWQRERAERQGR